MKNVLAYIILSVLTAASVDAQSSVSPTEIFNQVWKEFDERYSVFEVRGVDWDAVRLRYEPMVTDDLTHRELFDICCQMVSELKDSHVTLVDKTQDPPRFCNSFGFPDSRYSAYSVNSSIL